VSSRTGLRGFVAGDLTFALLVLIGGRVLVVTFAFRRCSVEGRARLAIVEQLEKHRRRCAVGLGRTPAVAFVMALALGAFQGERPARCSTIGCRRGSACVSCARRALCRPGEGANHRG